MKILITGKRSYVATNLSSWLKKNHPYFQIDQKSIRNGVIPSLKQYDVIIHCAGLVHKSESRVSSALFMKVNRDLTAELAKKAKEMNVNHFIYLSSMAVYGVEPSLDKKISISKDTNLNPSTLYGKSKLQAESELSDLQSKHFKVAIIRPPTVYGKNAPGNYNKLAEFAKITPIFPLVKNERSMINIANLCQLINLIITFKSTGIFHPQDDKFINTSDLVKSISPIGKRIYFSELLGSIILVIDIPFIRKLFGNLIYEKDLSNHFDGKYIIYPPKAKNKNKNNSTISLDL